MTKLQIFTLYMILLLINTNIIAQNKKIILEGVILDDTELGIPYAAITIPSKNIGTTSTNEGGYYLIVSNKNLQDTLVISSMGFNSYKIRVQDYVAQNVKSIVLKENITSLDDVKILAPKDFIKLGLKRSKDNYISDTHLLKILYRRSSVEKNISKLFIEQYISLLYSGPGSWSKK